MKKINRYLNILFLLVLLLLALVPPYYGEDANSGGQVHASVGHFPIWKTIPHEKVFNALVKKGRIEEGNTIRKGISENSCYFSYTTHINIVRLIADTLLILSIYVIAKVVLRMLSGRWHKRHIT